MRVETAIPEGVKFADLNLSRSSDGGVSFDWGPIERICEASGLKVALLKNSPESNVADLLTHWYAHAVRKGEPRDPVADDLFGEALSEYN